MSDEPRSAPAIGTAESAVLAFVNVLANTMEIREEQLAYWLDCYYQLRRHYEREANVPDLMILRRSDLEPVIRQLWQETLKKSCRKEAEQRLAEKAAPIAEAPTPKPTQEAPAPTPMNGNKAAAIFKGETRTRLLEARRKGLKLSDLEALSEGHLTQAEILTILESGRTSIDIYRELAAALDRWTPPKEAAET